MTNVRMVVVPLNLLLSLARVHRVVRWIEKVLRDLAVQPSYEVVATMDQQCSRAQACVSH